jgi:hypothetical protein
MDGNDSESVSFSEEAHDDYSSGENHDDDDPAPSSDSESVSITNHESESEHDDDDDDDKNYEVALVDQRRVDAAVRKEASDILSSMEKNRSSSSTSSDNDKQQLSPPRSRRSKVSVPATIPEDEATDETEAGTTNQKSSMLSVESGGSLSGPKGDAATPIPNGLPGTDLEGYSYHFTQSSHSQANSSYPQSPRADEGLDVSPTSGNKRSSGHRSTTAKSTNSNDGLSRRSGHRRTNGNSHGRLAGGPRITWKADPEESFSDWRIEVYYDQMGGERDVYHIHRNICGFGPRKSDYLLQDFRSLSRDVVYDSEACVTRLDLPAARAHVFPMVLDFMYYSQESKQTLTAERACHVFKLAELLSIPGLQKAIADFYMKNLSLKNMGEFLTAANQNKADGLLVVSKAKIGQMITEKPELSGLVPPKFLADILLISRKQLDEAREKEPEKYSEELVKSQSRYWSKAACICAAHNEGILTRKLFDALTSEESLPFIDSSVAPKLLSLDAKFNPQGGKGKNSGKFTSLQRRCVDSISEDFRAFQRGFSSPEAVSETLTEVPSHVLAAILVKSMNRP